MNLTEYFACPYCGGDSISLLNAKPIMSDVRVDTLKCSKCETVWNLYSKITEVKVELISVPEPNIEETAEVLND